jgi:hypothetical protein
MFAAAGSPPIVLASATTTRQPPECKMLKQKLFLRNYDKYPKGGTVLMPRSMSRCLASGMIITES